MRTKLLTVVAVAAGVMWPAGRAAHAQSEVTTRTADGLELHGEAYDGNLSPDAPLILLFHQGGSSGRGEYGTIARWLNASGYRAIAWDQRAGGDLHGIPNRTATGAGAAAQQSGFCHVYPDLEAALDYVLTRGLARRVILWGSSYSGALVFRLAAEHPDHVDGVAAFSPASGGATSECHIGNFLDRVRVPVVVFRPASELQVASVAEQRRELEAAGIRVHVIEHGVHGSSMLLDERTGADMAQARELLLAWLGTLPSRE